MAEPVSGLLYPVLLEAVSIVVRSGKLPFNTPRMRIKVARASTKEATRRGIQISTRSIRKWLARPDTREQIRVGTAETVASAVHNLEWRMERPDGGQSRAAELLLVILTEFIRFQSPADATALGASWQMQLTVSEGRKTREESSADAKKILDKLDQSQGFPEALERLHPWRRDEVNRLLKSWPPIAGLVGLLVRQSNRGQTLRQWAGSPPEDLAQAPADVWCWFGLVSGDYGEPRAAMDFIMRGIEKGAVPTEYWLARACIIQLSVDRSDALELPSGSRRDWHPMSNALAALDEGDYEHAKAALSQWSPSSADESAIKAILLANALVGQESLNQAIIVALDAVNQDRHASGVNLQAATLLLRRARVRPNTDPLGDAQRAYSLAIDARDARRSWAGDSAGAVPVAVDAALALGDLGRASRLLAVEPKGSATLSEVNDPRVRRKGAVVASVAGDIERAREFLDGNADPFAAAIVEGHSTLQIGDVTSAEQAWMTAYAEASDESDKLTAISLLAEYGLKLPDFSTLERRFPDAIAEIRSLHDCLTAGDDSVQLLRTHASKSPRFVFHLSEYYCRQKNYREAALALETGADRFGDPFLSRTSADRYLQAKDYANAQRMSEKAIELAGSGWVGEHRARQILREAHAQQEHWDEAAQQLRLLLVLDPDDPEARWALVHYLMNNGDLEGAWNVLIPDGSVLDPRHREDAQVWISLVMKFRSSEVSVPQALKMGECYQDDEELYGLFLAQIYSSNKDKAPLDPCIRNELFKAQEKYVARFPNSAFFRSIPFDPDHPLDSLSDTLRSQLELPEGIGERVQAGELPLGILTNTLGISYAEASIRRRGGMIRGLLQQRSSICNERFPEMLDRPVALDTTGATTLAILDLDVRSRLIGRFTQLESTNVAYLDALDAQNALGRRATMSLGWDSAREGVKPIGISESMADHLAEHADETVTILRSANRRLWPSFQSFQMTSIGEFPWMATLDLAVSQQIAFWCDDSVLGQLATEKNIPTFGTADLLRYLRSKGTIKPELTDNAEAALVRHYYVDLGFDENVMTLAATMDDWKPLGAAFSLSRFSAWRDPNSTYSFLATALAHHTNGAPEIIREWIGFASTGLVRDWDQAASGHNLQVLLTSLLEEPWMRADLFPYVMSGVRGGMEKLAGLEDPLRPVLQRWYQRLVSEDGHERASRILRDRVFQASEADRQTALEVILTAD